MLLMKKMMVILTVFSSVCSPPDLSGLTLSTAGRGFSGWWGAALAGVQTLCVTAGLLTWAEQLHIMLEKNRNMAKCNIKICNLYQNLQSAKIASIQV